MIVNFTSNVTTSLYVAHVYVLRIRISMYKHFVCLYVHVGMCPHNVVIYIHYTDISYVVSTCCYRTQYNCPAQSITDPIQHIVRKTFVFVVENVRENNFRGFPIPTKYSCTLIVIIIFTIIILSSFPGRI